ncbi:MAG: flagellar motor switch phosphatase FliY, partial [Lachnospiraceae bacterium]|nr:flagellar motor switch phosphatase FliY [Lachnospiraceae bacterium]
MDGMLSQDEINALLSGDPMGDTSEEVAQDNTAPAGEELLTEAEQDAIGEVANISMGTSATTLYSLVNRKVDITTPVVKLAVWQDVLDYYEKPCVFIQIKYTTGLDGHNILILKEHDVKVIADLMMGGDGTNTEGELGELHLSAISEAMNQMMGSAATSLSQMLGTTIDISPPEASLLDLLDFKQGEEISPFLGGTFVKIAFRMQIGDLVDSNILQLYPIDFAKKLVDTFIEGMSGGGGSAAAPAPAAAPE